MGPAVVVDDQFPLKTRTNQSRPVECGGFWTACGHRPMSSSRAPVPTHKRREKSPSNSLERKIRHNLFKRGREEEGKEFQNRSMCKRRALLFCLNGFLTKIRVGKIKCGTYSIK